VGSTIPSGAGEWVELGRPSEAGITPKGLRLSEQVSSLDRKLLKPVHLQTLLALSSLAIELDRSTIETQHTC
jgi:hypothetical protein